MGRRGWPAGCGMLPGGWERAVCGLACATGCGEHSAVGLGEGHGGWERSELAIATALKRFLRKGLPSACWL